MREMSSSAWLRRGSSVVFDKYILGRLIEAASLVSLRQALGWLKAWPVEPPDGRNTLLVSGLETVLEVLDPADAEAFLRKRVKPLILEFQYRWEQCGLVFGFVAPERSFEVTVADEEVLFVRRDGERVHLSFALWDGSATLDVTRLVREEAQTGKRITVGYHVARIS
ncbi:MAG: hypothetical protein H5U02_07440 [Clostridia bacterium]|nr:hypothetical protein [Clostridia bacterium]